MSLVFFLKHLVGHVKVKATLILLLVIPFFVYAQDEFELINEKGIWDVIRREPPESVDFTEHIERYFFEGDTIFDAKTYKKLFRQDGFVYLHLNGPDPYLLSKEIADPWYFGCIRHDSLGQIFFRSDWDTFEFLLYKFNLRLNEVVDIGHVDSDFYQVTVTGIDSVLTATGYRLRYEINGGWDTWIEGIGSLRGLMFPFLGENISISRGLACYKENEVEVFSILLENIDPCSLFSHPTSIEGYDQLNSDLVIGQNGQQIVFTVVARYKKIKIKDVKGRAIYSSELTGENIFTLPSTVFCSGINIIQLFDSENNVLVRKVFVE